jgi:hypothetical protein
MQPPVSPSEPSTIEGQLKSAVGHFRIKQKQSDDSLVAWMRSCIEEIEQATDSPEKRQKQKTLASYWGDTSWSTFISRHCAGHLRNLLPDERSRIASITENPLRKSQRKEFLEQLHDAINRFYDKDDPDFKPVSLPEDYCALLSIANGVKDADIRRSGICGIDDISHLPLHEIVPEPEKLPCHIDYKRGWDIDIGIILGRGQPDHANWLVYCYCARKEVTQYGDKRSGGDIDSHERVWKWRLIYKEKTQADSFVVPIVFESIVDWLSWYQEWYHRFMVEHPRRWARLTQDIRW